MNKQRIKELEEKGFIVGNVDDFLGLDVRPYFVPLHNFDISEAKFRIGELVTYRFYDIELEDYMKLDTEIIGVNYLRDDDLGPVIEYALKDWIHLVYENELETL